MSTITSRGRSRRKPDEGPRASFRDLLPYLAEHRGILALVIALSIVGAAATLALPLLLRVVVSDVQHKHPLGAIVALVAVLVVLSAILSGFQHYLLQRTGTSVVLSARRRLIRHLLRLPVPEFDRRRIGDLVSRVGTDTTLLYAVLTQGLVDAVGNSLTFVGAIIGMAVLDPVLLGLTVLVVALAILVVGGLSRNIRTASRRQQDIVGELASDVERSISAVRTIRASGATERETAAVERVAERAWGAGIDVARASAPVVPLATLAMYVAFLVVVGVGGFRVAAGIIPIGNLVAFILFLFLMVLPLGTAFGAISSVASALGALGRITEVLNIPTETDGDRPETAVTVAGTTAIQFEDVSFGYAQEGNRVDVLHDVSFAVPAGTRTALVGPSGAGKSTMLSLLERFYEVDSGSIRVDGVDIRTMDRGMLRAHFGYVEQDAPALAGSIRDNLTLASPDATEAECFAVLDSVNLRDAILRHEQGLDAQVGEDGVLLSGGERQRLAIARTLLSGAPILLLDESTSNLDGRNEQLLRESIDHAAIGRTVVVIAHRLSTVVDADQIIVVDGGRVVATGTHSELVDSSPLYRELAASQLLV
jgi:ABC-type multidrug transport system fused ATPase/permease subunit